MTIPNILTVFRVLLVPVFLYYLIQPDAVSRIIALAIFATASITDFFDGYLARKLNQESKFGRFLDPLADKALVITSIFAFVYLDKSIPVWMVLVIIGRDMLITVLRFLAIRKGIEVRTTFMAKAKTTFQMLAIVLIICILIVRSYRPEIAETYTKGKIEGKFHSEIAMESFRQWMIILPRKDVPSFDKQVVFAISLPYFIMLLTTLFTILSGVRYIVTNREILKPPYIVFNRQKEKEGDSS